MSYQDEVRIARSLMESEGANPEFLSIHEAIGDLIDDGVITLTDDEIDAMALRINTLISKAVTTYEFPADPSLEA